mgnify:CR=1 FL=1
MAELSWDDARARLVPVLRPVTEPAQAWRVALTDPAAALVRAVALPMLHTLVAIEDDATRTFVSRAQAEAWGVDPADVVRQATENLAARATEGLRPRIEYGLWQLAAGDGLEASRLMLPGWLAGFRDTVKGRPVAIVPAPRVLLVGGDGAVGQIERLVGLGADGYRGAAQGLSPVPYTVDDHGKVVPWAPEGHPLAAAARASQRLLDVMCFAAQRDQLAGAELGHVPVVKLLREGVESYTVCPWGPHEGGTLLAETDLVQLDDGALVPFAAVRRHAGGALEATPLRPARWRARWPVEAVRRRLADEAIQLG